MTSAKHAALQHFLDRALELKEKRSWVHPLSRTRVAWRWVGSLLLFLYGVSLLHVSWCRYRCDADADCNPYAPEQLLSSVEARQYAVGQTVRAYSGMEIAWALAMPRPADAGGSLAQMVAGTQIWWLQRVSMPIDIILALPWWDLFAVAYPHFVKLVSQNQVMPTDLGRARRRAEEQASSGSLLSAYHHITAKSTAAAAAAAATVAPRPSSVLSRAHAGVHRWIMRTPVSRAIAAVQRVRALPPPPRLLQPLLEEYVLPLVFARSFGSGRMAAVRLMQALPAIGDALWEVQIAQAFMMHFVASAKILVLLASSLHAARTRIRLRRRRRLVEEQMAARRVAKHARRFLIHHAETGLCAAERTAAQLAAIETYRMHSKTKRRERRSAETGSPQRGSPRSVTTL